MVAITVLKTMRLFNTKMFDMIHLNYNNLDKETQQYLLMISKKEIENEHSNALKDFALKNKLNYEALLEEEAIRNLYNYEFQFSL